VLKSLDPFLRFVFVTGVTKFTKTSIFSGLNNLLDITMVEEYANICGIPADELWEHFGEHIEALAKLGRFGHIGDMAGEILSWYDGYSWDGRTRVLNPYSLLSFFVQKRFGSFWYASGTPSFLVAMLKEKPESFLALKSIEISERAMDAFDARRMEPEPLLFQTGYLTVAEKRYRGVAESYLLKIPNLEVREALYMNVVAQFTEKGETFAEGARRRIVESLGSGELGGMLDALRGLFASIPYELHIGREAYYHSIFYAVLKLLGVDADAEVSVSGGRVDAVIEMGERVYVMEFKYAERAPEAGAEEMREQCERALCEGMRQIGERGYAKRYAGSGKTVCMAAFAFFGRDDIHMRVCMDAGAKH
jgi:hypothetical protein